MAKQLTKYSVRAAGSWTIIPAIGPDLARAEMARRLGVERKPWLAKLIDVHEATPDEIERYREMVDVGPRKSDGRNVVEEKLA